MKKGLFSKIIVVVIFVQILWFTDRVLDAFEMTGAEPSTLIAAFFFFFSIEGTALYLLKKVERKAKSDIAKVDGEIKKINARKERCNHEEN